MSNVFWCGVVALISVLIVADAQNNLIITVDDQMTLYIDGELQTNVPNANNFTKSDSVPLPASDTNPLIAVKAVNLVGACGILASETSGTLVSDASWKCTNVLYDNWFAVGFDDSGWPAAVQYKANTGSWAGVSTAAYWIWTNAPDYNTGDKVIYCRKGLGDPDAAAANTPTGNCIINMRSYGYMAAAGTNMGWLAVNNYVVYNVSYNTDNYAHRGVNVVLIDPVTCKVLVSNHYDTYQYTWAGTDLSNFLLYLYDGAVLAGSTNDEPMTLFSSAGSVMNAANIQVTTLPKGSQFAFVTQIGHPETTVLLSNAALAPNFITLNVQITGTVGNMTFVKQ